MRVTIDKDDELKSLEVVDFGSAENKEEIFEYLEELRQSGIVNMYGAGAFLEDDFDLNKSRASQLLLEWFDFKRDERND